MTQRAMATNIVWVVVNSIKKPNAVVRMKAQMGGSTIWIRNISHWMHQPNL